MARAISVNAELESKRSELENARALIAEATARLGTLSDVQTRVQIVVHPISANPIQS